MWMDELNRVVKESNEGQKAQMDEYKGMADGMTSGKMMGSLQKGMQMPKMPEFKLPKL